MALIHEYIFPATVTTAEASLSGLEVIPAHVVTTDTESGAVVETPFQYNSLDGSFDPVNTTREAIATYDKMRGEVAECIHYITNPTSVNCVDDVYMGGVLTRQDFSIGTDEGIALLGTLQETWPDELPSYTIDLKNKVASFTASRPPYVNNSISFYNFEEPSADIKATYGLTYERYLPWYGLKFDTVTEEVMSKIVIDSDEMRRVAVEEELDINTLEDGLPATSYSFYARMHNKDGTVDSNIDVYFYSSEQVVSEWCVVNSYTFPYDVTDASIKPKLIIWGAVYNTSSKTITHLKAYTRRFV